MIFARDFEKRMSYDTDVIDKLIDYTHNNPDKNDILRGLLDHGHITLKEYLYAANRIRVATDETV